MEFRKRPVVIEAIQFTGAVSVRKMTRVWDGFDKLGHSFDGDDLIIFTPEGDHKAKPYDWIIKGIKGEFYPCKEDIFEATYEGVEDGNNNATE